MSLFCMNHVWYMHRKMNKYNYRNREKTDREMWRHFSSLPLECLQTAMTWQAVGWMQGDTFSAWEPQGTFGTKVTLKQRGSVSQHFQNGSGWQSIDITHDKNKTFLTFLVLGFGSLHACMVLLWRTMKFVLPVGTRDRLLHLPLLLTSLWRSSKGKKCSLKAYFFSFNN